MITYHTKDNIAYLTLASSKNLVNEKLLQSMIAYLNIIEKDNRILGTILTCKHKDFCYGADIDYLSTLVHDKDLYPRLNQIHESLLLFQKPMVAIISGKCIGGGLELVLLCPYRIGIQDSNLLFSLPEVTLGIMPGLGATQRLPRAIGLQPSMQLILNQGKFDEKEALNTHLIHALTTFQQALYLAKTYLKKPFIPPYKNFDPNTVQKLEYAYITALAKAKTQGCYPNVEYCLQAIYEGSYLPLKQALSIEAQYFTKTLQSPQTKLLLPLFVHRQRIRKEHKLNKTPCIGIVGGGFMGSAIAKHTLSLNIPTTIVDLPDRVLALQSKLQHPKLTLTDQFSLLSNCTVVIESIPENLELKQSILKKIELYISKNTLLCSNTSALPIYQLSKVLSYPNRFIGMHFFSPVDKMPIVEIIPHSKTCNDCTHYAKELTTYLLKTPIESPDILGFYTTNIVLHYLLSALELFTEGIHPILIENAAKQIGMKTPPFVLLDEIGIDVAHAILQSIQAEKKIVELIEYLYRKKYYGRKTNQGFYTYPNKQFSQNLLTRYPLKHTSFATIKKRLLSKPLECASSIHKDHLLSSIDAQFGLLSLGFSPIHIPILD